MSAADTLREVFWVSTAVVVIATLTLGDSARAPAQMLTRKRVVEIVLPPAGGPGSIPQALWKRPVGIQKGPVEWEGWSPEPFSLTTKGFILGWNTTAGSEDEAKVIVYQLYITGRYARCRKRV